MVPALASPKSLVVFETGDRPGALVEVLLAFARRGLNLSEVGEFIRTSQPKAWERLDALPKSSVKYGSIASSTRGSVGVVAWWSR